MYYYLRMLMRQCRWIAHAAMPRARARSHFFCLYVRLKDVQEMFLDPSPRGREVHVTTRPRLAMHTYFAAFYEIHLDSQEPMIEKETPNDDAALIPFPYDVVDADATTLAHTHLSAIVQCRLRTTRPISL